MPSWSVTAAEGRYSVERVLAAYRSAAEGRRAELPLARWLPAIAGAPTP